MSPASSYFLFRHTQHTMLWTQIIAGCELVDPTDPDKIILKQLYLIVSEVFDQKMEFHYYVQFFHVLNLHPKILIVNQNCIENV